MKEVRRLLLEKREFEKGKENFKRNTWTPNDILLYEDRAEIILRDNKQKINGVAIIGREDMELIKKYKWNNCEGYARTCINNKTTRMHRLLLGFPTGFIDHINRNTLDNRRANLRVVTPKENNMNVERVRDKPPRIFVMGRSR